MRRDFLSILLFLVFLITALADSIAGVAYANEIAIVCVIGFIGMEINRVARLNLIAAALLAGIGITAGLIAGNASETLLKGIERTLPFLLLFGGVLCLRIPANTSPSLLGLRDRVVLQPPGRRYLFTAISAHCLTIIFNLAGVTLLSSLIRPGTEERLQRRLGRALAQGLASATCWAPFFVAAVVIYSVLPTVRWSTIAPAGIGLSVVLLSWSWLSDRVFVRPAKPAVAASVEPAGFSKPLAGRGWLTLLAILLTLLSAFVIAIDVIDLSVPVTIALVGPPFSLIWLSLIRRNPRTDAPATPTLRTILSEIPSLRNEATLFCAANILAVGIGIAVTPDSVAAPALAWAGEPFVLLAVLVVLHGGVNALGVHPVVPAILIPTLFPPQAIGVPPELMALALLGMWGQGASVSPFSATVFMLARLSGQSNWTTSWGWNGWYVASSTILIVGYLYVIAVSGVFS